MNSKKEQTIILKDIKIVGQFEDGMAYEILLSESDKKHIWDLFKKNKEKQLHVEEEPILQFCKYNILKIMPLVSERIH
jgi:hypothetical protein